MSSAPLVLGVLAVLTALLLVGLVVLPGGPRRVPLSRLDPSAAPPSSAFAGAGAAAEAAVENLLSRGERRGTWEELLERAGVGMSLTDLVLVVVLLTPCSAALGFLLAGPWLIVPFGALVPVGTRMLLSAKVSRRQAAFADQLDDSLQLMASSLRAGHSVLRAIDAVSHEAAAPTAEEFARVVNETRVGRDLTVALEEVAERMESDDFAWVAQAIAIQREVGGNLAEVLDAVGHTIRERNAIRRQVKALSAEGKLSAFVLMGLPFGICGFIWLTNPGYLAGFVSSPIGVAMLAVAALLLVGGGFWLKKMVSVRF